MLGPFAVLVLLTLALGWTILNGAGTSLAPWQVTLLLIGLVSAVYWRYTRRTNRAPALNTSLRIAVWALPGYILLQLVPLPLAVLQVVSPARAALANALLPLSPGVKWAPISTTPVATLSNFFAVLCYLAIFLLIRELAWRWNFRPWIPVIPLIALAGLEAVIGLARFIASGHTKPAAGTYSNPDHYAAFLNMILPLGLLYGAAIFRDRRAVRLPVFWGIWVWVATGLMVAALGCSLSYTGIVIAVCVLFTIVAPGTGLHLPKRFSQPVAIGFSALILGVLIAALPAQNVLERFVQLNRSEKSATGERLTVWRQTMPMIAEFPLFGCGLGGFEPNFLKFQAAASAKRVEFAHNDYLQSLAELGVLGFAILLIAAFEVLRQIFSGISGLVDEERRYLVVACGGGMVAILLQSLVDFNMHIPANAMALAWIAGVGSINGLD